MVFTASTENWFAVSATLVTADIVELIQLPAQYLSVILSSASTVIGEVSETGTEDLKIKENEQILLCSKSCRMLARMVLVSHLRVE